MKQIDRLLENTKAILFDADGTLIDSMGLWGEVDKIYLARYGMEMPEGFQQKLSGLSIMQTAEYFYNVVGIHEPPEVMIADWNALAMDQYRYHVQVKPGVYDFLEEVAKRGIKMGVCTSNTSKLAHTVLDLRHISGYMQTIITGEDVKIGKPDPYIYNEAARRIGVDPSECLVFEDIAEGIMAGKNAGMRVVAVEDDFSAYQRDQKRELADYYIESFEDIFNDKIEVLK